METKAMPNLEVIVKELVLPEWLNGKEASQVFLKKGSGDINNMMETCRCFQNLYEVICSARLNLACACREKYPELIDPNNPQLSHVWMRSQFVNNAILWYNAAFDLSLQPLWMYYKIYEKVKHDLKLTTNSLDEILKTCRFDILKNNGLKELGDNLILQLEKININMQNNIRLWANTLKHRKKIEYDELSKKDHPIDVGGKFAIGKAENGKRIINLEEGVYNSAKTIFFVNMDDVIKRLISFHKEIIPITKDISNKIDL